MAAPWARFTIELDFDREDEGELEDISDEIREELLEMIDRYRERGFKIELSNDG